MSWSLPIFRVAGIQLRIHITFLLLIVWLAFGYYAQGGSAVAASRVIFALLLFLCVVLHECRHADELCARYASFRDGRPGVCFRLWLHRVALESVPDLHRAFRLHRRIAGGGPGADERCVAPVSSFQCNGARIPHAL